MYGATNLSITDERSIIGSYKADNLTDPDMIYSRKVELLRMLKQFKLMGWCSIVGGIPCLLFIIPGLFLIGIGIWVLRYTKKKEQLIESATEKYCLELEIEAV